MTRISALALVSALLSTSALAQAPAPAAPLAAEAPAKTDGKPAEKAAKPEQKAAKPEEKPAKPEEKPAKKEEKAKKVDIVDTAIAAGNFTKLAAALQAAGLVEALKKPGQLTVFAPTDEAFAKIPQTELDALLANKEQLTRILQAHVVKGTKKAKSVKAGKLKTLGGAEIEVTAADGKVTFGGANVTTVDIEATNGVIHVIDTVVIPK